MSTDRERLFDIILEEQKQTRQDINELKESISQYHNDMKWVSRIGHGITAAASILIVKIMDWFHIFQK